ncbi:MAG: hypothetical protein JXA33_10920 [Anaerolineae bacterium]|nr:hypothetical protein [Anaerolineae bacterium]
MKKSRLILVPALILRVWLAVYPEKLWYDEGFSVLVARLPWQRLLDATAGDVHPPAYYAVLKVWLWGMNVLAVPMEPAARLLSVLLSVVALGLFWGVLGCLSLSQRHREVALIVAAYIPGLAFHSAEARMYGLLSVFVLGAAWALLRMSCIRDDFRLWCVARKVKPAKTFRAGRPAGGSVVTDRRGTGLVVLVGLCMAGAALTHNIGIVYDAALALAFMLYRRDRLAVSAIVLAGTIAAFLWFALWFFPLYEQARSLSGGYWTALPTLRGVAYSVLRAVYPPAPGIDRAWEQVPLLAIAGVTTWAVLAEKNRFTLAVLLYVPAMIVSASYATGTGLLIGRTLQPWLYFLAIAWGGLLVRPDVGKQLVGLLAVVGVLCNASYAVYGRHGTQWEQLDAIQAGPYDIVYSIGSIAVPMLLYYPDVPVVVMPVTRQGGGLSAQTLDALGVQQARLEKISWQWVWFPAYSYLAGLPQEDLDYMAWVLDTYRSAKVEDYHQAVNGITVAEGGIWLLENSTLSAVR